MSDDMMSGSLGGLETSLYITDPNTDSILEKVKIKTVISALKNIGEYRDRKTYRDAEIEAEDLVSDHLKNPISDSRD